MLECEQSTGLSVLEHGIMVKDHLFDLIDHLRNGSDLEFDWRIPEWIYTYKDLILQDLPSDHTLSLYTKYHDCGKPFCIEVDELGKRHFPNHSNESHRIFNQVFDDPIASNLILHDMDIHLLKSDGVSDFCKIPNHLTLLITGLSEIHANSRMFGGMESINFKIKWKHISKKGNQIIKK